MRVFLVAAGTLAVVIGAACDSSVRVGELREEPPEAGAPPTLPIDAGGEETALSWKQHAPMVPCSVYAMADARAAGVWVGCNGGGIYLYDGVAARLAYSADEASIVSLLWTSPDGQVWAGAQSGFGEAAKTRLLHFDGGLWKDVAGPASRITSLTGVDAHDVWLTTDAAIYRLRDGVLEMSLASPGGAFRGCAFVDSTRGYCVGTGGLAVAWDGTGWTALAGAPWTPAAEVFGVEIDPFAKSADFFYGEPAAVSNGDHQCSAARLVGPDFLPIHASTPCFASFSVARRRTGRVNVGTHEYLLLAPDEQYGGTLVFDPLADAVSPLCGPVLTFSTGLSNTSAGGFYGLLATIVGSGGSQVALSSAEGSAITFDDLSVAPDGTAWARTEDSAVCGTVSGSVVRFGPDATWQRIAGPSGVQSGRGLAATAVDGAYTIDLGRDMLLHYTAGAWVDGPTLNSGWSLAAPSSSDVWIGGIKDDLGKSDGATFHVVRPEGRTRQIEQVVPAGADVWLVSQGVTSDDSDVHLQRYSNGKTTEWNLGLAQVRISAVDEAHVWVSGSPAQAWNGATLTPLAFDATDVWARSSTEIYFTKYGDISRWDGNTLTTAHHGFIPIRTIAGAPDGRGFAVGPGGLTLELGHWPETR